MGSYMANCPLCGAKKSIRYRPDSKIMRCRSCKETFDLEKQKPTNVTIDEYIEIQKYAIFLTATNGYNSQGRGVVVMDIREWPPAVKRVYLSDTVAQFTIGWPSKEVEEQVKTYIPDVECMIYIYDHEESNSRWKKLWMGPGGKG
jgi:hypothetical protein